MQHTTHYDAIAQKFNLLWQFSDEYKDFVIGHIHRLLALESNDILVDIGGGTGSFTERLSVEASLQKAYCVEPSKEMCNEASHQPHVNALCTDAKGFVAQNLFYTKMLFKEVIHHLHHRHIFWQNIYTQLPKSGKVLIITRPQEVAFPFWSDAADAFKQNQPPLSLLRNELEACGFSVDVLVDTHTFTLPKEDWFTMLRGRFMSDLSHFSDDAIEKGIDEINEAYEEERIDILDHLIFITATKNGSSLS